MKPDPDEFPEFDNNLRASFEKETQLFFNAILRENRPGHGSAGREVHFRE